MSASEMIDRGDQKSPAGPRDWWLLLALLGAAGFFVLFRMILWDSFADDLSALYLAGYFFAAGEYGLIYDAADPFLSGSPPLWLPYLPELSLRDGDTVVPYLYPPLWAALLAPLTEILSPYAFFRVVAPIELALMLACIPLGWRLCRSFAIPLGVWALIVLAMLFLSLISVTAIFHLQVQIIVVFLVLLAFERYQTGRFGWAGVALALAAALKLAPAALALIFLLDRNWRALGTFALVGLGLAGLGLLIAGPELHWAFLDASAHATGITLLSGINYSAEALLYAASAPLDWSAGYLHVHLGTGPRLLVKAIGAAALLWAIWATHQLDRDRRLPARLFLFGLLLNLFGPLGWVHYYLLQMFLLPGLLGLVPRRIGLVLLAGFAVTTSWPLGHFVLKGWLGIDSVLVPGLIGGAAMVVLFLAVTRALSQGNPAKQPV